uniref:Uncharacterized protein n=1 Tax=Arundo donax TaxID=35708 RepID=A0A0A9GPQ6_ARUDO
MTHSVATLLLLLLSAG